MIVVVTVLLAVPLGLLVRQRFVAHVVYAMAYLWAFTFQTLYLVLDSIPGATNPEPPFTAGVFPWSYGVIALGVLGVGVALVEAGRRLAARRVARAVPVPG